MTQEQPEKRDQEMQDEAKRRLRRKNIAVGAAVVGVMVILYFVTMIRTGTM